MASPQRAGRPSPTNLAHLSLFVITPKVGRFNRLQSARLQSDLNAT